MIRSLHYVSKTRLGTGKVLVWVLKWVAVPGLEIIIPKDSAASHNQAKIEPAVTGIEVNIDKEGGIQDKAKADPIDPGIDCFDLCGGQEFCFRGHQLCQKLLQR